MKKQIITSVVSYVALALGVVMFAVMGLFDAISGTITIEYGLKVHGFNVAWDLKSLLDGGLISTNIRLAVLGYILMSLVLVAVILLVVKPCKSRKQAGVELAQVLFFNLIGLGGIFACGHFAVLSTFKNFDGMNKFLFILMIVLILGYIVLQVMNFIWVVFAKPEAQPAAVEQKVEEPVEEEKVEEVKEVKEEPVEEKVEEVKEEPVQEKVEEVKEEPVEEKVEEPVHEEPAPEAEVVPAPAVKAEPRRRISFEERLNAADPELIEKYKEIREEIMSYGIKSRVSSSGDTFRLHTVKYMKIIVAGKKLKLYMKLDPHVYDTTTIPHGDASKKSAFVDIPMIFKVQSGLSVKRAKTLIKEMMDQAGYQKKEAKEEKKEN